MQISEALKQLKKLETRCNIQNEILKVVICTDKYQRIIEVPLHRPTRVY